MERQSVENFPSIRIARFFMQTIGMWYVEKKRDKIISNVVLVYTIFAMLIALTVVTMDFYYSWGDLHAMTYTAPCTTTVLVELLKLLMFVFHRTKVMDFNAYTENTFWKIKYEMVDFAILKKCNMQITRMNVILAIIMQTICWLYLGLPIFESAGKNSTERVLPFQMWFNLPFSETPYYEITYVLQAIGTMSTAICATTFGSFLFTVCIYATGQFEILQRRLETSSQVDTGDEKKDLRDNDGKNSYDDLKGCILQHLLLTTYMDKLEDLYCYIMMGQALGAVLQICFSGFQILLGADESILRTARSVQFFTGSSILLYLFAWSCHQVMESSMAIAEAAYRAAWFNLSHETEWGRAYRIAIQMIIMRARRPCILTVGKFAPMSLETFSAVINTAISYFTILMQMNEEAPA